MADSPTADLVAATWRAQLSRWQNAQGVRVNGQTAHTQSEEYQLLEHGIAQRQLLAPTCSEPSVAAPLQQRRHDANANLYDGHLSNADAALIIPPVSQMEPIITTLPGQHSLPVRPGVVRPALPEEPLRTLLSAGVRMEGAAAVYSLEIVTSIVDLHHAFSFARRITNMFKLAKTYIHICT